MRVIVTAYTCEPAAGSEAGIGWNWVRELALRHEVWLVTRHNQVDGILREAERLGLSGRLNPVGYDPPRSLTFWKKGSRHLYPYVYLWQLGAAKVAAELHMAHRFDVAHHVTFATSWIPSFLHRLGIAFVWGPVGRNEKIPDWYVKELGLGARAREVAREIGCRSMEEFAPGMRGNLAGADKILLLNSSVMRAVPQEHRCKVEICPAMGTERLALPPDRFRAQGPLRVIFAARLIPIKGHSLALRAMALVAAERVEAELWIVGDGPLRSRLQAQAAALGVAASTRFFGNQPRAECLRLMTQADVLLFPTFEAAGVVLAEGMEAGCAVVGLNRGGPAAVVPETCGILVPSDGPETTVRGLAGALVRLAKDRDLCIALGRAGIEHARAHLEWRAKGEVIERVYREAIAHRQRRPGSRLARQGG